MPSLLRVFVKEARQVGDFARGGNNLMLWIGLCGAVSIASLVILDINGSPKPNSLDLADLYVVCEKDQAVEKQHNKIEAECHKRLLHWIKTDQPGDGNDVYFNSEQKDISPLTITVTDEVTIKILLIEIGLTIVLYVITRLLTNYYSTSSEPDMNVSLTLAVVYSGVQIMASVLWILFALWCYYTCIIPNNSGMRETEARSFECPVEDIHVSCSYHRLEVTSTLGWMTQSFKRYLQFASHNYAMNGNIILCLVMIIINIFLLVLVFHVIVIEFVFWFLFNWIPRLFGIRKVKTT